MNKFKSIIAICVFLLTACTGFSYDKAPYLIKGEMVMDSDSEDYEIAGINLSFKNLEKKTVSELTVVFFMFDEDGEPVSFRKGNMVLTIKKNIASGEYCQFCVSLDKYLTEIPEEPYFIDYLYVSEIVYEDESTWKDPLGMMLR